MFRFWPETWDPFVSLIIWIALLVYLIYKLKEMDPPDWW